MNKPPHRVVLLAFVFVVMSMIAIANLAVGSTWALAYAAVAVVAAGTAYVAWRRGPGN